MNLADESFTLVAEWEARTATQSVPPLIAISDPKEHLRRRKPWNRALNVTSLRTFEPIVANRAEQLVTRLSEQKGPTNLAKWFSWFTYVLVAEVTRLQCAHTDNLTVMT